MYVVYFGDKHLYSHTFFSESEAKRFAETAWSTYSFVAVMKE